MAAAVIAAFSGDALAARTGQTEQARPVPAIAVPGGGVAPAATRMRLAQSADAGVRINQLEEQIRLLNGRIEEMNFQLLELQEAIRRMQEDNEFRFQQLEQRGGLAGGGALADRGGDTRGSSQAPQPAEPAGDAQRSDGDELARAGDTANRQPAGNPPRTIDGVEIYDGTQRSVDGLAGGAQTSDGSDTLASGTLGTLVFDDQGNIVAAEVGEPIDLTQGVQGGGGAAPTATGNQVGQMAALSYPDDPDQLYEIGYGYIQAGDYALARRAFAEFSDRYPADERLPEARFWLGETYYAAGDYEEAARIFLEAHKQYPQGRLGPQTLLRLASSLAGMNQRELACATYAEVPKKYPGMSNAVRSNLEQGQRAASCIAN